MGLVEICVTKDKKVSCDGTKGSSKHPLIYLNMGKKSNITCPYCSKFFTNKSVEAGPISEEHKLTNK